MRSWIKSVTGTGSSNSGDENDSSRSGGSLFGALRNMSLDDAGDSSLDNGASSRGFGISRRSLQAGIDPRKIQEYAEMERLVTEAARKLGASIESIVLAAQGKNMADSSWKDELLNLFGGSDENVRKAEIKRRLLKKESESNLSIDILLRCSSFDKFCSRSIENQLPTRLIHCLRLFRLIELGRTSEYWADNQYPEDEEGDESESILQCHNLMPTSTKAVEKVETLFCLLCTHQSLGDKLRPDLFGLLALSDHAYPSNGSHIAKAASTIVCRFSENCLSASLVWFLHANKMVINMTDDVKELIGMTSNSTTESSSAQRTMCLYGEDAEKDGMWVYALTAVVSLVSNSCNHQTLELLHDFDSAGGYYVLSHAIIHSSRSNKSKLLDLAVKLSCCKSENMPSSPTHGSQSGDDDALLIKNSDIFQAIIAEIALQSIPFIVDHMNRNNGAKPNFSSLSFIQEATQDSLETAFSFDLGSSASRSLPSVDVAAEILMTTLQMYTSHPRNFKFVESKFYLLSMFLLAFPTISDDSTKICTLKTLEYVCTSAFIDITTSTPVTVAYELYVVLCEALLQNRNISSSYNYDLLQKDAEALCETLETAIKADEYSCKILCDCGLFEQKLSRYIKLLVAAKDSKDNEFGDSRMEASYLLVCRILCRVVIKSQSFATTASFLADKNDFGKLNLSILLSTGVRELSEKSSRAALKVFQEVMCMSVESLEDDIKCLLDVLDFLAESFQSKDSMKRKQAVVRQTDVLNALAVSMKSNEHARPIFRECGGFDTLLHIFQNLDGIFINESDVGIEVDELKILSLVEALFSVISCALLDKKIESGLENDILFYSLLARVISNTGVLHSAENSERIINLALAMINPMLSLSCESEKILSLQNSGVVKLVLSLITLLPEEHNSLAEGVMSILLKLCSESTCRGHMANASLIKSLTVLPEFSVVLSNRNHPLHGALAQMLEKVASLSMSSDDFISFLRCIGLPLLRKEKNSEKVVLPVIVSSLQETIAQIKCNKYYEENDNILCEYLQLALNVSSNEESISRYSVGGSSIDKLTFYMQDIPIEERMYKLARMGELAFVEIPSIYKNLNAGNSSSSFDERLWSPSAVSGFSYITWLRLPQESPNQTLKYREDSGGIMFLLDLHTSPNSNESHEHLALWYDLSTKQINVSTTATAAKKSYTFPPSNLSSNLWNLILVTYAPPKRTLLGKKAQLNLYINGLHIGELKIEQINLPSSARGLIGCCNVKLIEFGKKYLRGPMPRFEIAHALLVSKTLSLAETTSMYVSGPDFDGLFWGDTPERTSLRSTACSALQTINKTDTDSRIVDALRLRGLQNLQNLHSLPDSFDMVKFKCRLLPNEVVFSLRGSAVNDSWNKDQVSLILRNVASLSKMAATDAIIRGNTVIVNPKPFSDNLRWIGGPSNLFPLVYSAQTSKSLPLALNLVRVACQGNIPNIQAIKSEGGYRTLAFLLCQKVTILSKDALDACFSFAVQGYDAKAAESRLLISDLDALKYLVLNGQVWQYRMNRPLSLRLLSHLNELVAPSCAHLDFNTRILHHIGIVKWVLHLMFESVGLFDISQEGEAKKKIWRMNPPSITDVCSGKDTGDEFLLLCKQFLTRMLRYWLVGQDVVAIADGITSSLTIERLRSLPNEGKNSDSNEAINVTECLSPIGLMRIYLVELLQDLVIESVKRFVAVIQGEVVEDDFDTDDLNQSTTSKLFSQGRKAAEYLSRKPSSLDEGEAKLEVDSKISLPAISEILSPQWFASVLDNCSEEASAGSILRLMVLSLQASQFFTEKFKQFGGFTQYIGSIPRFSTSPSVIVSLISHLVDYPVPQLPFLAQINKMVLCEVFVHDPDENPIMSPDVFQMLSECLMRNVQLLARCDDEGMKAKNVNLAVMEFISRHYKSYQFFQTFCHTQGFLTPFGNILFAYNREKQRLDLVDQSKIEDEDDSSQSTVQVENTHPPLEEGTPERMLSESDEQFMAWPSNKSILLRNPTRNSILNAGESTMPTEKFIGDVTEGINAVLVQLLHVILSDAVFYRPLASVVLLDLFRAFPENAKPEEVEIFQLMLLERSRIIIDDALLRGGPRALANCAGFASVLLDRLVGGFFRAEAVMLSVKGCINTLKALTSSRAHSALGQNDQNSLVVDMLYISRLVCVVSLYKMRPGPSTDDDLACIVSESIAKNAKLLLLNAMSNSGKSTFLSGTSSAYTPPSSNSQKFDIWQSASVVRALKDCNYPDLHSLENPDRSFVVSLMAQLKHYLSPQNVKTRESAVLIIISLLKQRKAMMSEILSQDVIVTSSKGETRSEAVDLFQRGGFGALLLAHESASNAENTSGVGRQRRRRGNDGRKSLGDLKYAAFFEWYRKNIKQIDAVFEQIFLEAKNYFPNFYNKSDYTLDAILFEQNLQKANRDTNFFGVIDTEDSINRIKKYHISWNQRGFDEIAYGAMKWKVLLRRLKGPFSLWERKPLNDRFLKSSNGESSKEDYDSNIRWKLAMNEGNERQRRKLIPNYEFHGLYSIDEDRKHGSPPTIVPHNEDKTQMVDENGEPSEDLVSAFLKEMHKKGAITKNTAKLFEDDNIEDGYFDAEEEVDVGDIPFDEISEDQDAKDEKDDESDVVNEEISTLEEKETNEEDVQMPRPESGFESNVIIGMLEDGDTPKKAYNISRCTGLEIKKGILLFCSTCIYVIDGFEMAEGNDLRGKINRVEVSTSTYQINLRNKGSVRIDPAKNQESKGNSTSSSDNAASISRCQRIQHNDLYASYKRRYQLRNVAVELFDVHRNSTFVAFATAPERDEFMSSLLRSHLPNSIFHSFAGLASTSYSKVMASYQAKVKQEWVQGKISNFDFLMHLNMFAGRSYNDLTQYPVFPWVLKDYESEELNLNDPSIYRDLSKPMGAQGEARAQLYRERFDELEKNYEDDPEMNPPPFHYGTHYSCAAYVLYYLMRLEPFSRLALQLQGGKFDVADRLFSDIGSSWKSAAYENFQDVRELIPEFYHLPDFLVNRNSFDFGETQAGSVVDDVRLPRWAKGDPRRFVRIHRMALESDYVSNNLHKWIDIIFGYKQRGPEAKESLNRFVHITYEGQVDLDEIEDPLVRESTITQIQNFGQTPSRLDRNPFRKRSSLQVIRDGSIDFSALPSLAPLTPPLCVVGAPHRVYLQGKLWITCRTGMDEQIDSAVGDIAYHKGQLLSVGRTCVFLRPKMFYIRYGGLANGVSIHVGVTSGKFGGVNDMISCHDGMHSAPISFAKASHNGRWLVTGCKDATVRVWRVSSSSKGMTNMQLQATLCGHTNGAITALDICTHFGIIATGGSDGSVLLWDLRSHTFLRELKHECQSRRSLVHGNVSAASISINGSNGNVLVLINRKLFIFDINGFLVAMYSQEDWNENMLYPTCALSTNCPEWMEMGVVAVTGHKNGDIRLWSIDYAASTLVMRQLIPDKMHSCSITQLSISDDNQDRLLVGDASGKVSESRSVKLDELSADDLRSICSEVKEIKKANRYNKKNDDKKDEDMNII